jgi:regulator of sirC expression with transglutaminase-like and TPR domain
MSKISEARQALDRMLHLQPESVRVRVRRGLAFQMAGLRDEALAEVEVALVLDPNDEEARKLKEDLQATGELCEGKEPAQ